MSLPLRDQNGLPVVRRSATGTIIVVGDDERGEPDRPWLIVYTRNPPGVYCGAWFFGGPGYYLPDHVVQDWPVLG